MDALDLGILRTMSRGSGLWWGSLDPRLSAQAIANALDVDRKTVWARLRAWQESGFHVAQAVLPNPRLFGSGIAGGSVSVPDVRAKSRVIDALRDIDGVLGGTDQVGEWIVVALANENREALDETVAAIQGLDGVEEAFMCVPLWPPEPRLTPTPLDWRVIQALSRTRHGNFADAAERVGVSPRTFRRRVERLVAGRAVWTLPVFDFRYCTAAVLARVLLMLDAGVDGPRVARACRERFRDHIVWCEPLEEFHPSPAPAHSWVEFTVAVETPGLAADVAADAATLDGVDEVEVFFPSVCFLYREWFDARVRARIEAGTSTARPRTAARAPATRRP